MNDRITTLLRALDSRNLFERQECLTELGTLGYEVIPQILEEPDLSRTSTALHEVIKGLVPEDREKACTFLVRALRRDRPLELRLLVLTILCDELGELTSYIDRVLECALDTTEPAELRARAFRTLKAARLPGELVRQIGALLRLDVLGPGGPAALRDAVFDCLKAHAALLPVELTMIQLDPFLTHPDPAIRIHALALLGEVGDLDAVERMCMLPNTAAEIDRIQDSIGKILRRPTNLLSLRWEHFEHFIGHLLRKMGHQDVEVVGRVKDDGVDLKSHRAREDMKGPARERWAVQCKRWTKDKVDVDVLERLIAASRTEKFDAKHALLVTTSDFTRAARDFADRHTAAIELVSGNQLLTILDEHLGAGRYTIRSRA